MSHHLVTVCMFCLLCATHNTCGSHLDTIQYHADVNFDPHIQKSSYPNTPPNEPKILSTYDIEEINNHEIKKKNIAEEKKLRYQNKLHKIRSHRRDESTELSVIEKRDVNSVSVKNVNPSAYLEHIFRVYGDENSMMMNLTGFQKMLESLDLDRLIDGGNVKTEKKGYIYWQSGIQEDEINVS